jgi:heme-degrading monooxygenase HmoA
VTTISKDQKLVTFINTFKVEPTNQVRLVELLAHVTDTFVRHAPGFISSSLHRSLDGSKVAMYAQWRTIEDYEAMRRDPAPLPYFKEALTIATFEPGMYEVAETFTAAKDGPA